MGLASFNRARREAAKASQPVEEPKVEIKEVAPKEKPKKEGK